MASVNSILTNFTAGEISERVFGRVDLAKYQNGARELTNVVVLPQGGARKRGGTLNVSNVKDNNPDALLVPFVFSTTQAYMLEFGPHYIRFFKDRGIIFDFQNGINDVAAGSITTVTAFGHSFNNFDRVIITSARGMHQINNREFVITNVVPGISFVIVIPFSGNVDSTGYAAYTGGGIVSRIYEIATNYSAADVAALNYTQSADTLFLFSSNWPVTLLKRFNHASWQLSTANVEEGPFLDLNTNEGITVSVDVVAGSG